jgi:hypothetical protein
LTTGNPCVNRIYFVKTGKNKRNRVEAVATREVISEPRAQPRAQKKKKKLTNNNQQALLRNHVVLRSTPNRLKGPGDYKEVLGNLLPIAGGLLGGRLAGAGGASLGSTLGSTVSKILGFGDYHISDNSLVTGNAVPTFSSTSEGMEVCHREYLGNVSGTTNFSVHAYRVNPGLPDTFPWLSNIAVNFDQYELKGLVFEYRPSSGMIAAASPALGIVIMSTSYDVYDPDFSTKQAMDAYEFTTSTVPNCGIMHPVECKPRSMAYNRYYVRNGAASGDERLYDYGKFQIATEGMQSSYVLGELWVTYHVCLVRPRIHVGATTNIACRWDFSYNDKVHPFGAAVERTPHDSRFSVVDHTITFHQLGNYIVHINFIGNENITELPTVAKGAGIEWIMQWNTDFWEAHNNKECPCFCVAKVNSISVGNTLQFTGPGYTPAMKRLSERVLSDPVLVHGTMTIVMVQDNYCV